MAEIMDGIIKSAEENKLYQLSTNPNQPSILMEEEIKSKWVEVAKEKEENPVHKEELEVEI